MLTERFRSSSPPSELSDQVEMLQLTKERVRKHASGKDRASMQDVLERGRGRESGCGGDGFTYGKDFMTVTARCTCLSDLLLVRYGFWYCFLLYPMYLSRQSWRRRTAGQPMSLTTT